jgi:beta-phosphoglucomutase
MAVASAADAVKVRTNIAVIGVEPDFFDALVTGSDVTRKKPAPDGFLLAAKRLGVEASECIVFEDAIGGIQAAVAAGMYPIGITSTFDEAALRDAGARLVLDGVYAFNGVDA